MGEDLGVNQIFVASANASQELQTIHFPSIDAIQNNPIGSVALSIHGALEAGQTPSIDVGFALVSRLVSQLQTPQTSDVHFYTEPVTFKDFQPGEKFTKKPIQTVRSEGLYELEMSDTLIRLTGQSLQTLPTEHRLEAVNGLMSQVDKVPLQYEEKYVSMFLEFIGDSPNDIECMQPVFDYLVAHRDDYYEDRGGAVEAISFRLGVFSDYDDVTITALAQRTDTHEVKQLLGMIINEKSYAKVLSHVQDIVANHPDTPLASRMNRVGRILLGLPPDSDNPFFTEAYMLYEKYSLDNYKYLVVEIPADIDVIDQVLPHGERGKRLAEIGSGTGRFTNAVAVSRPDLDIVGVEVLPQYVQYATERDTTGRVTYVKADAKETGLADNSVDVVCSFGRTMMAFDEEELLHVIAEMKRIGTDDVKIVFNYGDPESPKYIQDKRVYLNLLRELGVRDFLKMPDDEALKYLDVIISSSDGKNWVSRNVFPTETLSDIFRQQGMDLKVVSRGEPIPGLEGAYSFYYEAQKMADSGRTALETLSTSAQTTTSSF